MRENNTSKNKMKRRRRNLIQRRRILTTAFILVLILAGSIRFGGMLSSAHDSLKENEESFRYYKSIEIESGDTLWGIAEEYMTDEYGSIQEYIDELKDINRLVTDDIHEDRHLMIVYYDTEFRE